MLAVHDPNLLGQLDFTNAESNKLFSRCRSCQFFYGLNNNKMQGGIRESGFFYWHQKIVTDGIYKQAEKCFVEQSPS